MRATPLPLEDLNVPATINTTEKRLGYFTRRLALSQQEQNDIVAAGGSPSAEWLNTHLGLAREFALAKTAAGNSDTGPGPPSWASNVAQHWQNDAVKWPTGLGAAPPEVRMHFLLSLSRKLRAAGKRPEELEDLRSKLGQTKTALNVDERWDI